jgi:hypothetical protein
MRYLLCTLLLLPACERRDAARDTVPADSAPAATPAMAPVADRLIGTWTAEGFDEGSTKSQQFTITWNTAPDGSLAGVIAFKPGASYNVKVVSTGDSTIVYESEPHNSPTLKAQVVTRTEARLVGDSLLGTYEARATKGEKVLRGRFAATQAGR